jgi:hypothetical protein
LDGNVSRNIYFYGIYISKARGSYRSGDHKFFDEFVKSEIPGSELPISDNENDKLVLFRNSTPHVGLNDWAFKIATIRKSDLPEGIDMNSYRPMPLSLAPRQGLSEPCHFIVIDGRFVVAEFNTRAPRARFHMEQLLDQYVKKRNSKWRCEVRPIMNDNALEIIKGLRQISALEVKLAPNHERILTRSRNSIFRTLKIPKMIEQSGVTIRISSGGSPKRKRQLKRLINKLSVTVIDNLPDLKRQKLSHLSVQGKTASGMIDSVDLVNSLLKVKEEVVKLNSQRGVDSSSMFEKLYKAYDDHADFLVHYEL